MTIREILGLDFGDEKRAKYNANSGDKRISEVTIDGVKITGYSAFSFVRKLTYVKSPTRSADGTIGNLDSYPVFTTSQLQIDFSLLDIDMYRSIMNLIYARREHIVECYDIVRDTRVTEKMYFEPEELPKLMTITRQLQGYSDSIIELLGVQDYVVTMVGTNVPNEIININYYDRNNNIIPNASVQMVENTEIIIGEGVVVEDVDGYKFNNQWQRGYLENGVWEDFDESSYIGKQAYRVVLEKDYEKASRTISFKAVYKPDKEFNLVLNYGLGEPLKDEYGKPRSTFTFVVGETFGDVFERYNIYTFPKSKNPTVEFEGETIETHKYKGWYLTPQYAQGSTAVGWYTKITIEGDFAIYQLFDAVTRKVQFDVKTLAPYGISLQSMDVVIGSKVQLPKFVEVKYGDKTLEFVGWYTSYENEFDGVMPPKDITLSARWREKK